MQDTLQEMFDSRSDLFDHYADLINTIHALIATATAMKTFQLDSRVLFEICEQHVKYLRANTDHFKTIVMER